jgi:hypothetical protein
MGVAVLPAPEQWLRVALSTAGSKECLPSASVVDRSFCVAGAIGRTRTLSAQNRRFRVLLAERSAATNAHHLTLT